MPTPPRLPTGATLNPAAAEAIVRSADPIISGTVFAYWEKQMSALGERIFDGINAANTPAMKFAREAPNTDISELVPNRRGLTKEDVPVSRGGDREYIVTEAGCLISAEEIAQSIAEGATVETMFADLQAFREAAGQGSSIPTTEFPSAAARGLRATRELFDVARRFSFSQKNAQEFGITVPEALALHRQEGAFSVTPPKESFPHGPLIQTQANGCRIHAVIHSLNQHVPNAIERPGYNLVVPIRLYFDKLKIDGEMTPGRFQYEMLNTNLLVTGGLDTLVSWMPENRGFDELQQLMAMAVREPLRTYEREWKAVGLSSLQIWRLYWILTTNLVMTQIEVSETLPPADEILEAGIADLKALFAAHPVEKIDRQWGPDLHLIGNDAGTDTYLCLKTQCRWYASRMQPLTLLARQDRVGFARPLQRFSPFLTYLRFHTGDPLFMGILLRTLFQFNALVQAARNGAQKRKDPWGQTFLDALKRSGWSKVPKALKRQIRTDLQYWKKSVKIIQTRGGNFETMWRHLGLIEAIKAKGSPPPWVMEVERPTYGKPKEVYDLLLETAAVAKRTIKLIIEYNLLEAIATGLEMTPIDVLVDLLILPLPRRRASDIPKAFRPTLSPEQRLLEWRKVEARAPLAKTHNFERLRIVYAQAYERAFGG